MRTALLTLLALAALSCSAQLVQKCCGSSNSTFLWGFPTASHTQSLFLPSDLTGAVAGDVNRLYYRYGSTGEVTGNTLTGVTIRLGQTSQTGFTGGNVFFTGLDTVLSADSLVIAPGITGQWFTVALDTLFPFDPALTLIIDVNWTTSLFTNFGCYGTPNNDRKLHANNDTATTGSTTSTTWQDMGFDVDVGTAVPQEASSSWLVFPVPADATVDLRPARPFDREVGWRMIDAHGREVARGRVPAFTDRIAIDVRQLVPGIHLLVLDGLGVVRIIKE